MSGGLVGSLNVIEFDGANCDGKIEAIVTGLIIIYLIKWKDHNIYNYFSIIFHGFSLIKLNHFEGPHQTPVNATAIKTNGNKIKLEYQAKEIGMHKMEIFNDGKPILKKPFFIEVCDPSRVKISNLQDGVVGRDQQFKGFF
jgi:hypothetical protein